MSRIITLTVSDEVYAVLRRQAEAARTSPASVAASSLEQQFGHASLERDAGQPADVADQHAAARRFTRHFGAVDLGRATGADNKSIDADLAREYAGTHEPA